MLAVPTGQPKVAADTECCQNRAPPPLKGALLLLIEFLYDKNNAFFKCTAPPPKPFAVLCWNLQPTKDREEKIQADTAPPEAPE